MFTPVRKSPALSRRELLLGLGATLGLAGVAVLGEPSTAFAGAGAGPGLPDSRRDNPEPLILSHVAPTAQGNTQDYITQLIRTRKGAYTYPPKNGKLKIYYGATFKSPIDDFEIRFTIYDLSKVPGQKIKQGAWEAFLGRRGARLITNALEFERTDIGVGRKLFALEFRGKVLAETLVMLR